MEARHVKGSPKILATLFNNLNRHWVIAFIALISLITSSLLQILDLVPKVYSFYDKTINWREYETKKINRLSTDMSIDYSRKILGPEIRINDANKYKEHIFLGRNYFIQALTGDLETVKYWSITDCGLNPKVISQPLHKEIHLGRDSLSSIIEEGKPKLNYYIQQATYPSYATESYYGGNPQLYQTVYYGINPICDSSLSEDPANLVDHFKGEETDINDPVVSKFRQSSKVNSYGESSALEDMDLEMSGGEIGPNSKMIRTVRSLWE